MAFKKTTAIFCYDRSVKWSHLYKEEIEGNNKAKISQSAYIAKSAVGEQAPMRIKLTIEPVEA